MNPIDRDLERRSTESGRHSVLEGREYIRGIHPHKKSSVEEAREHPDELKACKSVLDGPACIAGLPHESRH